MYREFMRGIDVQAAANAFWADAPSSTPTSLRVSVAHSLQTSRSRTPRPRVGSHISPSLHRPPVLGSDRLLLWSTPAGLDWQADLEQNFPAVFSML